jgi:nucleoside-diphosphate-sugar epimerase
MKAIGPISSRGKNKMGAKQVLITGADGYLGMRLARKYLESTGNRLALWVRSADENEFHAKRELLARQINDNEDRASYHWGDLVDDKPFDSLDPADINTVIHSAAVTRFNVDEATAREVNINGTDKVLRFARGCSGLESIGLLSTVYASGLKTGAVEEAPLDGSCGFANHYERSKWLSENILLTEYDSLPWRILRVATVIADSDSGRVSQYNAFHNTLKLFYYGLLSLIPGRAETPIYFVTGEFATDSVFELMQNSQNRAIYNVAHSEAESLTLGELIELAFETFDQEGDFRSRRILHPLFSDAESFDLLVEGISAFGGGIVNQAVSSVAPFGKQLFIRKQIQNHNVVANLKDYRAPDARTLIRNTCEYLVRTRWGKHTDDPVEPTV